MKKTPLSIICLALALSACQPMIANRGNILDPDSMAPIKAGASTREDVVNALGSPTEVSTFDEKIWYYIGRQTEQYSFFRPDVIKQQVVEIDFDESGTVVAIKNLDLREADDISPIDRETPTYGHDSTFIRQLLGDLSHPMPGLKGSHTGDGQ